MGTIEMASRKEAELAFRAPRRFALMPCGRQAAVECGATYLFTVAQTSKSAVSQVSKPAGGSAVVPAWKPAIQQVWKPAARKYRRVALKRYRATVPLFEPPAVRRRRFHAGVRPRWVAQATRLCRSATRRPEPEGTDCRHGAVPLPKVGFGLPPGQWPGGTGESPVLPRNYGMCRLIPPRNQSNCIVTEKPELRPIKPYYSNSLSR
jgi:hypothetical protein